MKIKEDIYKPKSFFEKEHRTICFNEITKQDFPDLYNALNGLFKGREKCSLQLGIGGCGGGWFNDLKEFELFMRGFLAAMQLHYDNKFLDYNGKAWSPASSKAYEDNLESRSPEMFVSECLAQCDDAYLTQDDCFQSYLQYCRKRNWTPIEKDKLIARIEDFVYEELAISKNSDGNSPNSETKHGWDGIQLSNRWFEVYK